MRIPKRYGQSKTDSCAFCGSIATQKNKEGLLVCRHHLKDKFQEIKCTCGSWLEQRSGKFGPYFNCINCGNMNLKKALEIKSLTQSQVSKGEIKKEEVETKSETKKQPKEITISSNDVEYFD